MILLYTSLATYAATTVVRFVLEALTGAMMSRHKLMIAFGYACGSAALAPFTDVKSTVLLAAATLGGATVIHRLHRLLGAAGDSARIDALSRRR